MAHASANNAVSNCDAIPPLPTPIPGPSLEEQVYTQALPPLLASYAAAKQGLSANLAASGSRPDLLWNEEWRRTTATYLAYWRDTNRSVRELIAPPRFAAAHCALLAMADETDAILDNFIAGIDNKDIARIQQGVADLQAVTTEMDAMLANMMTNLQGVSTTLLQWQRTELPTETPGPLVQSGGLGITWDAWLERMGLPEQDLLAGLYSWGGS